MAKPIITLNGLKIVIMLGMLVIVLTGIRLLCEDWCGFVYHACWLSPCRLCLSWC